MNRDILQAAACEKVLNDIGAAREALHLAANPPGRTVSVTIPGLDNPITGERSL